MPAKMHVLNFEPEEMSPRKSIISGNRSPSRTSTKILSLFNDSPHETLIEFQRTKMILKQQKAQLERLIREKSENRLEIERLNAQLQSEKSASDAQIMELEDKVSDLLACNRQLRAEVARCGSPESSIHLSPVPPAKQTIIPSRWTRSQPNLKQTAKQSSLEPMLSTVSPDSIDFLESQVSDLAVESLVKAMEERPRALDLKPSELILSPTISIESPVDSLDWKPQEWVPQPPVLSKSTPRQSRFVEDFSFGEEVTDIQNINKSSRESDPGTTIDFSVKSPVPQFESTFIGESEARGVPKEIESKKTVDSVVSKPEEAAKATQPMRVTNATTQVPSSISIGEPAAKRSQPHKLHQAKSTPHLILSQPAAEAPASPTKSIYGMVSQVFLGEMLHKSTRRFRKTEKHERYFWVHPYSLTLYWDKDSPSSSGGPHQPKCLPIMGVSEENDMNLSLGLYHKSIVIHSGKRDIKLTCSSPTRHDIWMRSLRYLLAGSGK